MAVTANLKVYGGATMTAQDFALTMEQLTPSASGLVYGCAVSLSGTTTLNVAAGWAIVHGRIVQILAGSETITLPSSGTQRGQLYIKVDLSNTTTPCTVEHETASTLTTLTDTDDFNVNSGTAYLQLATFDVSTSTVSNVVNTASAVTGISDLVEDAIARIEAAAAAALSVTNYDSGQIGFMTSINASNTIRLHLHKIGNMVMGELHIKAMISTGANNQNYSGTISEVSIPSGFQPAHLNRVVTGSITNGGIPTNYGTVLTINVDGTLHWATRYPSYTERYFSFSYYTED